LREELLRVKEMFRSWMVDKQTRSRRLSSTVVCQGNKAKNGNQKSFRKIRLLFSGVPLRASAYKTRRHYVEWLSKNIRVLSLLCKAMVSIHGEAAGQPVLVTTVEGWYLSSFYVVATVICLAARGREGRRRLLTPRGLGE
jgi:hypothetical protein